MPSLRHCQRQLGGVLQRKMSSVLLIRGRLSPSSLLILGSSIRRSRGGCYPLQTTCFRLSLLLNGCSSAIVILAMCMYSIVLYPHVMIKMTRYLTEEQQMFVACSCRAPLPDPYYIVSHNGHSTWVHDVACLCSELPITNQLFNA